MARKTVQPLTRSSPALKEQGRTLLGLSLGFRDCAPETLDALVAQGSVRWLGKGQALTSQGELLQAMCLLVQGALEISVTRRDGRRHMVGYIGAGSLVGLVGLMDGLGELNDVRARSESAVITMPASCVRGWLRTDPGLGVAIAMHLALRNRFMSERLAADPSLTILERLARLLLNMHKAFGAVNISQSELADWVGASRQRVNFALQALQTAGLIRVDYSVVDIVDIHAFEAYLTDTLERPAVSSRGSRPL